MTQTLVTEASMANPQACPHPALLQQLEGGQSDADIDAVVDHLERCERCQAIYGALVEEPDPWLEQFAGVAVEDLDRAREALANDTAAIEETAPLPAWFGKGGREDRNTHAVFSPPCDLKHYKVLRRVGKGGMGEVYEGWDTLIERRVAIKVQCKTSDLDGVQRFRAELSVNGQLDHPNIVKTYAGEQHEGTLFLIQEYLDGASLHVLAKQSQLGSPEDLLEAMIGVCRGLQALHAKGIVHRDIKPDNVMRLVDGSIKLIDYGLALPADAETSRRRAGAGTPGFMAPEQMFGEKKIDHRSDIYSFGRMIQYLTSRLHGDATNLRVQELAGQLNSLGARMCEREAANRPENLSVVLGELLQLQKVAPAESAKLAARRLPARHDAAHKSASPHRTLMRRWGGWWWSALTLLLVAPVGGGLFQFVFKTDRPAQIEVEGHKPGDILEISTNAGVVRAVELGEISSFFVDPGEYTLSLEGPAGRDVIPSRVSITSAGTLTVRIAEDKKTVPPAPDDDEDPLFVSRLPTERQDDASLFEVSIAGVMPELTDIRRVVASPDGTKAVVGTYAGGLSVVDITSLEHMRVEGGLAKIGTGWIEDLAWSHDGKYVYAISHEVPGGLHVIDVSNPVTPSEIAFYKTPSYAHAVEVAHDGKTVFVADGSTGVLAFDVSEPATPKIVGRCRDVGYAQWCALSVDKTLAFVPCAQNGVRILDVSDPAKMTVVGSVAIVGECWRTAVSRTDQIVYVADRSGEITVVDAADPASPGIVAKIKSFGRHSRVFVSEDGSLLGVVSGAVAWFDISDPAAPQFLGSFAFSGGGGARNMSPLPFGDAALVAVYGRGLVALRLSPNESAVNKRSEDSMLEGDGAVGAGG